MNMEILVHIGLLYIVNKVKLFSFTVFGVAYVPEEIEKFIGHKNIKKNI